MRQSNGGHSQRGNQVLKILPDDTGGLVLTIPPDYCCQICIARLEQEGKPTEDENAAIYEFRTGGHREQIFFCAECLQRYFKPE
jgi:hypothetical protein